MVPGSRALFFLVSLFFLIFVYCTHCTFGEEQHDASGQSGDAINRRLAPGAELTDPKIELLSKVFRLEPSFLKDRYSYRYNSAAAEASRGNFKPLAGIVAELFGTLNNKQLDELLVTTKTRKTEELSKTPPDPRFVSFLDKFIAAGERIQDPKSTPPDEETGKFLEAFEGEFTKIKESNTRFHEKVQQALAGNRQAKDFLRSNYDPKSLLSFMDAQRASGNQELARSLAKSLGEFDDSGNHSIDFVGPQGSKERLKLGSSDADVDKALNRFSSEEGFGSRAFSPLRHARPDKTFEFPPGGGDTKITELPAGETAIQPGPVEADKGARSAEPTVPAGKPASKAAEDFLKATCVRCHGPGGRATEDFALNANGTLNLVKNKMSLSDAMTRVLTRTLVDKDMPPTGGPLKPAQEGILKAWAKEQDVTLPK